MPDTPAFEKLEKALSIKNPIQYFNNMNSIDMETLQQELRFFQNNYAPMGGRMYVTDINALRIDYARNTVEEWKKLELITQLEYDYLVAAIIEGIPFVSNIAGTYGAYNKKWDIRSNKKFELIELPVINNGKNNKCNNEDGVTLLKYITGDILYIDPPYNEHNLSESLSQ